MNVGLTSKCIWAEFWKENENSLFPLKILKLHRELKIEKIKVGIMNNIKNPKKKHDEKTILKLNLKSIYSLKNSVNNKS